MFLSESVSMSTSVSVSICVSVSVSVSVSLSLSLPVSTRAPNLYIPIPIYAFVPYDASMMPVSQTIMYI